ncbi:MAG TPA: hypothetical protein VF324_05070 [Methanobacterium sp.]
MKVKRVLIGLIAIFIVISGLYAFSPQPTSTQKTSKLSDLEVSPVNATYVVIGASSITVPPNAKVVTQVDRVIKDKSSNINTNVPPDKRPTSTKDLVPFMEGARVAQLMKYANVTVIPAANVPIKKINGIWYGPDDKGNFVYEVDPSKTGPLFSTPVDANNMIEVNTHGMNVMVPEAIKENASLVIACGDLRGKAKAQAYMAEHGINSYCPCDRFTSSVMPYNGTGVILGTEPIRQLKNGSGAIIGGQPIAIKLTEPIVVQTTTKTYPDQYCDTPKRFFDNLQKAYGVKLNMYVVDANVGQTDSVVAQARKTGANVIGVRVLSEADKKPVATWLRENSTHKAVLFHSAPYEPGYSLFFEFPYQVTGQDVSPKFVKAVTSSDLDSKFAEIRSVWM